MGSLFERLESALARSVDPAERIEFLAEQGCYAARQGDFPLAREKVLRLRQVFLESSYAPALNWVMLIEGLLRYFEALGSSAHDRTLRAFVCSRSLGLAKLTQHSAAWLAHFEFERTNIDAMVELLVDFDPRSPRMDPGARLRFAMVLADAHMYVGQRHEARYWYEVARNTAVDIGDQVALGALMYNRAVFGLANIRIARALGQDHDDSLQLELASRELASAKSFEGAVNVTALKHLILVGEGRVALLRGEFSRSLQLMEEASAKIVEVEDRPNRTQVLSDVAYCQWRLGRSDEALRAVRMFLCLEPSKVDADDWLVGLSAAVEILESAGAVEMLAKARTLREAALAECIAEMRCISEGLSRLERHALPTALADRRGPEPEVEAKPS